MPNRIIKESICISESIDKLSWFEEVFFYRLIVNCDDFGRFHARPAVLKARLFPLKDSVSLADISSSLSKLASLDMVRLYEIDGKPYLYIPSWGQHQSKRAQKSKFPAPDSDLHTSEINGNQMQANVPVFENRIRIREPRNECVDSVEPEPDSTPPVIILPLNDGSDYAVTEEQCQEWAGLYPAVDVIQQLRKMKGWLDANPKRRKTKRGIKAFVVNWLSKEQDRGHRPTAGNGSGGGTNENIFAAMLREEEGI